MISVALCTYNGEKYIEQQLDTLIHQTLPPDEIIICDDQSRDRTVDIIRNTLRDWHGSWKLICNQQNLGYKKNFQKAISLCSGDIIFLCDQDDVWDYDKIAIMMPFFEDLDVILVFHDADIVNERLETIRSSFLNELKFDRSSFQRGDYSCLFIGNFIQGAACGFRKKLFDQSIPFPDTAFHDEWLALNAALLGKIIVVPRLLLKYRQRGDNALGGPKNLSLIKKIKDWLYRFQNKKNDYLAYQEHQIELWNYLAKKYPTTSIGASNPRDFFKFLSKRRRGILNKSWKNLPSLNEYKKFYIDSDNSKKLWVKDRLLTL